MRRVRLLHRNIPNERRQAKFKSTGRIIESAFALILTVSDGDDGTISTTHVVHLMEVGLVGR